MMNDIDRIEAAIGRLTDSINESERKTQDKFDKLTDAITSLTVSQSSFYEHREASSARMDKCETKLDKLDDRLRTVEQAAGVSSIWSDINKTKAGNIMGWIIAAIAVLVTILDKV